MTWLTSKNDNDLFEDKVQTVLDGILEDESFEDFLEKLGITPFEIFMLAYDGGLVDEDLFEAYLTAE